MSSFRDTVMKILCDTTLFPAGSSFYSWEVIKIVKPLLTPQDMEDLEDVDNSIREALETISGYNYSNGTQCSSSRQVTFKKVIPPIIPNPHGYNVEYTFR